MTVFVPARKCRTVMFHGVAASVAPKSHILFVWSRTSYQIGPGGRAAQNAAQIGGERADGEVRVGELHERKFLRGDQPNQMRHAGVNRERPRRQWARP